MPFLGVFSALLFVFLSITPDTHDGVYVTLPEAQSATLQPGALREDAIRIAVARDGRIFFGSAAAQPGELPNLIHTALRHGSEKTVYLLADSRAKNGDIEIVVDQMRLAGITNLVILAEKPAAPGNLPRHSR